MKMVSYSCETPFMNDDGLKKIVENKDNIITQCYEGTYLSVFNNKDKWYVSTRRCVDSKESLFNTELSHFDMFEETLKDIGYDSFDLFSTTLDKSKSYYFVLIHYLNKHVIDYSKEFGENYKKLCLTSIRNLDMTELDNFELFFISVISKSSSFSTLQHSHPQFSHSMSSSHKQSEQHSQSYVFISLGSIHWTVYVSSSKFS